MIEARPLEINPSGSILGIDPGKKFLGLSLSDPKRRVATPLTHMKTKIFRLFGAPIKEIIQRHGIAAIVMGFPLTMEGKEGTQARWVRHLAKQTQSALQIPVILKDERRTTASILEIAGKTISKAKEDTCAATLILQGFLDQQQMNAFSH